MVPTEAIDTWQTLELERSAPFGRRRRELDGILPSGSLTVDAAMGVGGLPRGRMIELFGPPAVGKTTMGLQAVAAVQRTGDTVAFVDAEHTFDSSYAARVGVSVDGLLLAQAPDGRQAFLILERLVASKAVDLIVVDSVAALLPPEERDEAIGEASPFAQSEMLASGLRRLARVMQGSPACVLFLNQLRTYQGVGYAETSVGGWALKLHAAVRADLREHTPLRAGKRLRMRVVKNQLARPVQMEFDFADGVGAVAEAELIDRALECGVLRAERSGLFFDGAVVGRNREDAVARVAGHVTLAAQMETEVRLALGHTQRRPAARAAVGAAEEVRGVVNG